MVNPLTGDEVRVSPIALLGMAVGALTVVIMILGWSYTQQGNTISRLQESHQVTLQALGGIEAELKAHEMQDARDENIIDAIAKKQAETLSRLAAIETHDLQTAAEFANNEQTHRDLATKVDDLERRVDPTPGGTAAAISNLSQRIDALTTSLDHRIDDVDKAATETQRQLSAIEGKLGESIPDVPHPTKGGRF